MAATSGREGRVPPARRDPEGRRRALVRAAAELTVEGGGELTHRRVAQRAGVPLGATTYYFSTLEELREAALRLLAEEMDKELARLAEALADGAGSPAALAEALHAYLTDRPRVQADAALYFAAVRRPALRPLALRWFDGLVHVLSAHTDPASALAVAVFTDGAANHAMLHDKPLDVAALTRALGALMPSRATESKEDPQ
ncbi:TetR/AcrR family transcriptional regulator [Streptomyces marincola]|uniref:TetR/AcrR family transcriptional regulator n=1 Tax=Streptomyces marincola TaxID=2878388 RepID=UPI000A34E27C|nr:TetR family transcriptional regulator [Streptomyces marincola]